MQNETQYAIVNSGDTVSGVFPKQNVARVGIQAPALGAAMSLYLHGGSNANSNANFTRVQALDGSGDFSWSAGSGENTLYAEVLQPYPFARIELGAAATDTRTFTIHSIS